MARRPEPLVAADRQTSMRNVLQLELEKGGVLTVGQLTAAICVAAALHTIMSEHAKPWRAGLAS